MKINHYVHLFYPIKKKLKANLINNKDNNYSYEFIATSHADDDNGGDKLTFF